MTDVNAILQQRGARYGDFRDHARVAQNIKGAYSASPNYGILPDMHRQALEVIADKIARILTGDYDYDDNWIDIQGYARLVQERLPPQYQVAITAPTANLGAVATASNLPKDCSVNGH